MKQSEALALPKRTLFSPRHFLITLLLLYAFIEFFPVSYSVTTLSFLAVTAFAMAWLLVFDSTALVNRQNYQPLIFFSLWLAYAMLSYLWALDKDAALEGSFLVFRYLVVFIVFDALFRQPAVLKRAHRFFAIVLGLYFLIALWEIFTFNHLPSSRYYEMDFYFMPTGPFYNQNNLAAFMLFILPFLVFLPKLESFKYAKILTFTGSLLFLIIITLQGARIAILGAALMFGFVWLFNAAAKSKTGTLVVFLLIVIALMQLGSPVVEYGWKTLKTELESFGTERDAAHMSSVKIRKQLIYETLDLAAGSAFMGLGGGNYEHYMDTDRVHRTGGIINAHNWFLEILGNYGVLILAGFVYLYLKWLLLLWQKYRSAEGPMRSLYLAYIWALLMFIPTSALPSSIRWNHHVWIIFAAINAMAHNREILIKD